MKRYVIQRYTYKRRSDLYRHWFTLESMQYDTLEEAKAAVSRKPTPWCGTSPSKYERRRLLIHFSTIVSALIGGMLGWNLEFLLSWVKGDSRVKRSKRKNKREECGNKAKNFDVRK